MNFKNLSLISLLTCSCALGVTSCSNDSDDSSNGNNNYEMPYTPTTLSMDHFDYMYHVSLALISSKDSETLDNYFNRIFSYADEFVNYDGSTRGVLGAGIALTRFCKAITDMSNSTATYACQIIESKGISHEEAFNAVRRLYPDETAESWWAKYSSGQIHSFQTYSDLQFAFPFEFEKTRQEIVAGLGARCIEQAVALVAAAEPSSFADYGSLVNDIINSHSSSSSPADLAEQYLKAASRFLVKNDDLGITQDALDEIIAQAKAMLSAEQPATDFIVTDRYFSSQTYWYADLTDNSGKVIGQKKYLFDIRDGKHTGTLYYEYNDSTRDSFIDFAWIVDEGNQLWLKNDNENEKSVWQVMKVYDTGTDKIKIVLRKRYTPETMTLSNYSTFTRQPFGLLTYVNKSNLPYSIEYTPWSMPWTITLHSRSFSDVWTDTEITDNTIDVSYIDNIYEEFPGQAFKTLQVEKGKINVSRDGISMNCTFDSLTNTGSGTFTFLLSKANIINTAEKINGQEGFNVRTDDVRNTLSQIIEARGTVKITYDSSSKRYKAVFETTKGSFSSSGQAFNYFVWDISAGEFHVEGTKPYSCEGKVYFSFTLYYK